MRILLLSLVFSFLICSCQPANTDANAEVVTDQTTGFKQPLDTFKLYQDTLKLIESKSLSTDSYLFKQFYDTKNSLGFIYHETGQIQYKSQIFGISAYTINDSTTRVKLLKKDSSQWVVCDTLDLFNIRFSPAMFHPVYADFNQNGVNDVLLVFYQTMSVAYRHGYLIVFSKETEQLTLIENSLDIPELEVDNNKIISITHNHPGHEPRKYRKINEYIIQENQLVLVNSNKKYLE